MARGKNPALVQYLLASVRGDLTLKEQNLLMKAAEAEAIAGLLSDRSIRTVNGKPVVEQSSGGSNERKGS